MTDTAGDGPWAGVDVVDGGEVTGMVEPGGVPCTVAELTTAPAVTSAAVTVYRVSAVQVSDAPGASVSCGQVVSPTFESATAMLPSVRVPVLVTLNVYAMVSPASMMPSLLTSVDVPACLTSDKRADFAVLVIVQFTKSPTASVTDADAPAAPEGNELSVAPFLVQDHDGS